MVYKRDAYLCRDVLVYTLSKYFEMSVAIFLHAPKVVEGNLINGMLMYPTSFGTFKTDEDREAFSALFQGEVPKVPYGGIGKEYGSERFALKEVQAAVLAHMKKHFSTPKDVEAYWELDGHMHDNLVFHPSVIYGIVDASETHEQAAIRSVWEWTGMRVDAKELVNDTPVQAMHLPETAEGEVSEELPVFIFHVNVSIDRAKWEWMNHMAEKRTLTDWHVSPYKGVLAELGIPDVIYNAYCKTHGGPRFISSIDMVKDAFTQRLMAEANVTI
tara:strand:+ start:38 stop:853 length:816 start_codon:yes stop_codon:yes gene_type:complete